MADQYVPVTFNDGAPLDPQKLMELQSNVKTLFEETTKLKNSTGTANYTVATDCGRISLENIKANVSISTEPIAVTNFTDGAVVVAIPGSNTKGAQITINSSSVANGTFTLSVKSNLDLAKLWINWHIAQRKY